MKNVLLLHVFVIVDDDYKISSPLPLKLKIGFLYYYYDHYIPIGLTAYHLLESSKTTA